jgi:uncharacterized protein (TIGR03435 family)
MRALPAVLILTATAAFAQSFDSVTIRPNRSPNGRGNSLVAGDHLFLTNFTLRELIQWAYDVRNYQLSGGTFWMDHDKFDVEATSIVNLERAQMKELLRPLLADRFGLVMHRETKALNEFVLLADKRGHKLRPAQVDDEPQGFRLHTTRNGLQLSAHRATVAGLAAVLGQIIRRQVVDQTGIQGDFDFTLAWTPEAPGGKEQDFDLTPSGPGDPLLIDPLPAPSNPAPFKSKGEFLPGALALQLGLRLESRKLPVEVLSIDHAVRIPTEN